MKDESTMSLSVPSAEDLKKTGKHKARKSGKPENAWVSATFKIPRPTYRKLREYASAHETSIQQILEESLDAWLAVEGEDAFYPEGWGEVKKRDRLK